MAIAGLGHVGLYVSDVEAMTAFYVRTLDMTITDRDDRSGTTFLSTDPDREHHELVLVPGPREAAGPSRLQQLSFRAPGLEDVVAVFRKIRDAGVELDKVVSHGNAVGVYFFDPEGNRCEVYCHTGLDARQPFLQAIDLDEPIDEVLRRVREAVERHGSAPWGRGGLIDDAFRSPTSSTSRPPGG